MSEVRANLFEEAGTNRDQDGPSPAPVKSPGGEASGHDLQG